jgi:hypothetical protein
MSDQFDTQEGPVIHVVFGQPRRISKIKTYQWEDCLGDLPPRPLRINFEGENCWLEQLHYQDGWVAVAQRENRQWVSLFSNLRVEQKTPEAPIDLIEIKEAA